MEVFTESEIRELLNTLPEAEVIVNALIESDLVKIVSDESLDDDN